MRAFVYLAYHSSDRRCIDCLQRQLSPLVRLGLEIFDPGQLSAGESVELRTHDALHESHMAIVLVSKDLLYDDTLITNVVTPLVRRQQRGEMTLLWLLGSPCVYELSPLGSLAPAHDTTRPLSTLSDFELDVLLLEMCDRIWSRWLASFSISNGPMDSVSFVASSMGLEREDHYRELRLAYEIFNRQRKSYMDVAASQLTVRSVRVEHTQKRTRKRFPISTLRWQRSAMFVFVARDVAVIVAILVFFIRQLLQK